MLWFQRTRRGADTVTPPTPATPIAAFTPTLEPTAGYVARLFVGDRQNPTAWIHFGRNTNGVYLSEGGLVSKLTERTMLRTTTSYRFDGERLLGSSQPNVQIDLKYFLYDDPGKLSVLQREITRFFEDARHYNENGRGERVLFEHRWYDNLDDLPPPVWGQMSQYREVIMGAIPEYPDTALMTAPVGYFGDVVANIITKPYGEGVTMTAGQAVGNVQMVAEGLLVGVSQANNLLTNSDFSGSPFDDGWTATSGLIVEQSTDIYRSGESAAKLVNNTLGVKNFTLTPDTSAYSGAAYFSCYIYSESAPNPSQLLILDDEETGVANMLDLGGNWYWVWRRYDLPSSGAFGVRVVAGANYVVDNFLLSKSTPLPIFHADWHSNRQGQVKYENFGNNLARKFTIAGWATLYYDNPNSDLSGTRMLFSYESGSDYLHCKLYPGAGLIGVEKSISTGSGYSDIENFTLPPFDVGATLHFSLVQNNTSLTLYINGSSIGSLTIPAIMAADGDFYLGSKSGASTESLQSLNGALDGWKIWNVALSATQVTQLYTNELPVKEDVKQIGPPPVWWTGNYNDGFAPNLKYMMRSHDYDNHDPAQYHNWGVLMGVGGDAEARLEINVDRSTYFTGNPSIFRFGRRESAEIIVDVDDFFTNFSTSSASNSSFVDGRGSSQSITTGNSGYWEAPANPELLRGKHRIFAHLYFITSSQTVKVRWTYHFGPTLSSDFVYGPWLTVNDFSASWRTMVLDLGDANIQWPILERRPATVTLGVQVQNVSGTSPLTVWCDYIQAIPYPVAKLLPANLSTIVMSGVRTLVLSDFDASLIDTDNLEFQRMSRNLAEPITAVAGRYNYIFIMPTQHISGRIGETLDKNQLYKLTMKVTPRYGHIGGPG